MPFFSVNGMGLSKYMQRVRVQGGVVLIEDVEPTDADAIMYWRLDTRGAQRATLMPQRTPF